MKRREGGMLSFLIFLIEKEGIISLFLGIPYFLGVFFPAFPPYHE